MPKKTMGSLALAIVDAACELRDLDWNNNDPGPFLDQLDRAVDAYRKEVRRRSVCQRDLDEWQEQWAIEQGRTAGSGGVSDAACGGK